MVPIKCKVCQLVIGVDASVIFGGNTEVSHTFAVDQDVPCIGKDKHLQPVVTKTPWALGLVEYVTHYYPETNTTNTFLLYTGDKYDTYGLRAVRTLARQKAAAMFLYIPL